MLAFPFRDPEPAGRCPTAIEQRRRSSSAPRMSTGRAARANTILAMRRADQSAESPERTEASKGALVLARSVSAGKKAGANASRAGDSLVRAVGRLVNRAVEEMLL